MTLRAIAVLVALASPAGAASPPARPTPSLYVTENHGVAMRVPPGLSYCPLPDGWEGTDHGTTLYMARPTRCPDPDADRRIAVYYGYNVAEHVRTDGTEGPPLTDMDLAHASCATPQARPEWRLLDRPATVCTHDRGAHVEVSAFAVFDLRTGAAGPDTPDSIVVLALRTTPAHATDDFKTFGRVLTGLAICTPDWGHAHSGRAACPAEALWW